MRADGGEAIEMRGWMDGGSVSAVFVSTVYDSSVGLLHLVESKKTMMSAAHVCVCGGVKEDPIILHLVL